MSRLVYAADANVHLTRWSSLRIQTGAEMPLRSGDVRPVRSRVIVCSLVHAPHGARGCNLVFDLRCSTTTIPPFLLDRARFSLGLLPLRRCRTVSAWHERAGVRFRSPAERVRPTT